MNRRPVRPVANASGANTEASVSVMATIGEADLARSLYRRLAAGHPRLDVPEDVLQHHDRVVDDEPDRQHHRQERQRVDREAEHVHQRERADQRHRYRDQRDDRRAQAPQGDEDHQPDQQDGLADRAEDIGDRAIDENGRVVRDDQLHARRHRLVHLHDLGAHRVRQVERIGDRLLDHADVERGLAIEARDDALLERTDLGVADVANAHRIAADVGDNDVVELFGRAHVGFRDDGELARLRFDAAGRNLRVLSADRVLDVLHGQLVAGEPRAVDIDSHRHLPLAEDAYVGRAGEHG